MSQTQHNKPNHIVNISGDEAVAKLKELAEGARIGMFTTFTSERPMPARPLAIQSVDVDGTLNFFITNDSNTFTEIRKDAAVQIYFANNSNSEYLSIYGQAHIVNDREKVKRLFTPWAKVWFQGGPEDPTLVLVCVKPESTVYWDTKNNKMIQLIKMAASLVTGKTIDDGVEGELRV
jgi:general stress protein 26